MTAVSTDSQAPRPIFSKELYGLAERFASHPGNLGELLRRTQGRGIHLLLIIAALPFLTPIPLPGFSIPFGLVALIAGTRMALGKNPWLPKRLLSRRLPPRFLGKLLRASSRVVRWLEYFLRPRLRLLSDHTACRRLAGAFIALSGLLLTLPLPVPFSNSLPAFTILLLAAGALEQDGAAFLLGSAAFLLTAGFFVFLTVGGMEATQHLRLLFTN
jgi:hypothetical protein